MSNEDEQQAAADTQQSVDEEQLRSATSQMVSFGVTTPIGERIEFPQLIASVDTIAAVKQSLCDLQETCFYSNYSLVYSPSDGEDVVLNDFVELSNYMARVTVDEKGEECLETVTHFEVRMVPDDYDVKKARAALKRTRELIKYPPTTKGVLTAGATVTTAASEEATVSAPAAEKEQTAEQKAAEEAKEEKAIMDKLQQHCSSLLTEPSTSAEKIFQCPSAIGSFFEETLFRGLAHAVTTKDAAAAVNTVTLTGAAAAATNASTGFQLFTPAEIVRSIVISGYNPPPPARALQGDLMYVEVQLGGPSDSESGGASNCLHITVVAGGFYVNNSTYKHFDPTPSNHFPNAAFSHELFTTICQASLLFKKSWNTYVVHGTDKKKTAAEAETGKTGAKSGKKGKGKGKGKDAASSALATVSGSDDSEESDADAAGAGVYDMIGKYFSQGRGDDISLQQSWLVPTATSTYAAAMTASGIDADVLPVTTASTSTTHKYDMSRVQEELSDGYGVEDKGITRDWNEEVQAMRELPSEELSQRIQRSRFMYKLIIEFSEACKLGAMAISNGYITALNSMDDAKAHVFVYNSIFFSRAYDTKETIRLCVGDDACRKVAAQELKNQKLIQALDIEGISPVLSTIVDYKGERYICQTIVPGILQSGESSARLMYGVLEAGKKITVKNNTLKLMNTIGSHLYLAERNVPLAPVPADADTDATAAAAVESEDCVVVDKNGDEEGDAEAAEAQPMTIRVDTEDEVAAVVGAGGVKAIPHVGPIEAKILQGSDRRLYAMEMVRLTPRDANYISKENNGTDHIDSATLATVPLTVSSAYTLRHELVHQYVAHVVTTKQQEIYRAWKVTDDAAKAKAAEAEAAAVAAKPKTEKVEKKEGEESKEEGEESPAPAVESTKLPQEVQDAIEAITPESLNLKLNVNCYTTAPSHAAGVDADLVKADEETIKTLSTHLFNHLLPALTERVRGQSLVVHDNVHLVTTMHGYGVNVRYLGQLLALAQTQEKKDQQTIAADKAAVAKTENAEETAEAPAVTPRHYIPLYWSEMLEIEVVARCAKHLLNELFRNDKIIRNAPAQAVAALLSALFTPNAAAAPIAAAAAVAAKEGNESEGKKRKSKSAKSAAKKAVEETAAVSAVTTSLAKFSFIPVQKIPSADEMRARIVELAAQRFTAKLALFSASEGADGRRISGATLVRRVCQVCGIRLSPRDYIFTAPTPFTAADVHSLVPVLKTSEPDVVFADSKRVLDTARQHMQKQNFGMAYELTSEAGQWLQQVVGGVHKEYLSATNQISEILLFAGDKMHAMRNASTCIALAVQLNGFDNLDTLRVHVQLSTLYQQDKDYVNAVHHLLAAKYIVQLLGGQNHPEIVNIYAKLGSMFIEIGGWELGLQCLDEAKARTAEMDVYKYCDICTDIAEFVCRSGMYTQAAELQKKVYVLIKKYYGVEHSKTVMAKRTLEIYLRASNEQQKYAVQMRKAQLEKQAAESEAIKKTQAMADLMQSESEGVKGQQDKSKKSKPKSHKKK